MRGLTPETACRRLPMTKGPIRPQENGGPKIRPMKKGLAVVVGHEHRIAPFTER